VTTITVALVDRTIKVKGRTVAPGLAVTPYITGEGRFRATDLFHLTHIGSGRRIGAVYCTHRIRAAVEIAVASGADWTGTQDELKANPAAVEAGQDCIAAAYCSGCDNEGNSRGWYS